MTTLTKNSLSYLLVALVILFIIMYFKACGDVNREKEISASLLKAVTDSLRQRNDSTTTITVIQKSDSKDFIKIEGLSQEIKDLQAVVSEYRRKLVAGSSVTNFSTETSVSNSNPTIIRIKDTVYKDGDVINPTYEDSIKNQWIDYKARMNKDSATLFLKITNSYSAVVGREKGKPFVDIVNHNPYSTTTKLRSFQVSLPRPKKWGIGLSSGVTYHTNKMQPYIGAGLNYSLIRF